MEQDRIELMSVDDSATLDRSAYEIGSLDDEHNEREF